MDTSNIDTSNIVYNKCCILRENISLKHTISLQSQEIARILSERDEYKNLYEGLLLNFNDMIYSSNNS